MTRFWRFTPLVALCAAVLLLASAVVIVVLAEQSYREQTILAAEVNARILARVSAAPLAFDDMTEVSHYLDALGEHPDVIVAAVYDATGTMIASYASIEGAAPPTAVEAGRIEYGGGRVSVTVAVKQQDLPLGTVYLQATKVSFTERLARYSGVVLLGFMMLVVLAVLGIAQATVNRANVELRRRAERLEETNTQLRDQIVQRQRAEEALRQAQKMESIGHLTGGIAHDFNNLLAIILGNLERLGRRLTQGVEPAQLLPILNNARTGAERAATLTRSLLAFSRRQPLKPQPVDLNRLVSGMSEMLRRTLGEHVTVETVVAGGLWRTLVDANQLESAIINLAVNARDAMPDGGRLTIETANAYLDARYTDEHEDLAPGQYVLLSITDTGVGMTQEAMERAFEPFFTTKDVGHGTGLGLSRVYGLVKQSSGHIKIYSELGEGTTIKIYLPRLLADEEPAALPAPADRQAESKPATRGEPILVVEDNDEMREHSVGVLAELGYRVFEAPDGAQALRILDAHPEIVLLFTDVGLPGGMNGRQLAEEALRRLPGLKVLYTTGYARNAIVHDGRLDPGVQLITKPFTYEELAKAVTSAMDIGSAEILIVEDEFLVRVSVVDDLADLGCTAVEAGSVAEARQQLDGCAGRFAAAIVDLSLPDHKGDGFIAEIRATWPKLPVIVFSGSDPSAIRPELAADSRIDFLPKPFRAEALEAVLTRAGVAVRKRPD